VGKIFSEKINAKNKKESKTEEKLYIMKQTRKNKKSSMNFVLDCAWKNPMAVNMII
jgi:hypothetical protein